MPRPKANQPKYVYHVSGQARVYLDGRYFYLGEYDSPQSWARYYALCDEYHRSGQRIPEDTETKPEDVVLTVRCVTADHREFARSKYAHDANRMTAMLNLCDTVDGEYADTPAAKFGPRKLAAIRELLVATKNRKGQHNTRRYINGQVKDIVRVFERAVSRELIEVSVIIALKTLPPLAPGDTVARESAPVEAVDIEAVRLTAKHLSPVIKAMVCIQVATGMRPSELFRMRPSDINMTIDGLWIYRPPKHKTTHHGKLRKIPIVEHARSILEPSVRGRDESAFCFSPEE